MFDADKPINSIAQDKLNRGQFAKYLARCLLDHTDPESLVVGLYGGWGVGKTSIINMMLEELKFASTNLIDNEKPIILNFSPWSYSGQHQLVYSFFRRLSSILRNEAEIENKEQIIYLLELYVSFFTHMPIPRSLQKRKPWWQHWFNRHHDETFGWESGRDLTAVKAELNELLKHQKRKIIIIIDNISRITPDEIKEMFQIVKSMGDYSNTRYLLSFDKQQVIEAINHVDGNGGEGFVEKIVQLPFEVPAITQQDLEGIFADRLKPTLDLVPENTWQPTEWMQLYYGSLKYFFHHCRDISHYANTLNFGYTRLRDVVNPVDYFALTALEVFAPQIYQGVRNNKDLFTDLLDHVYEPTEAELNREKQRCEEIIHRSEKYDAELIKSLLIFLFPRIRHLYYRNEPYFYSEKVARQFNRLCSPDLFDVYFRLSMPIGYIPKAEFDALIAQSNQPEAFDHALSRLTQDGRIFLFLNQIDEQVLRKIPRENTQAIINGLLDNGDLFPPGYSSLLSLDTPAHIHRIIQGLFFAESQESKFNLLLNGIHYATNSLAILIHEVKAQIHEEQVSTNLPALLPEFNIEQIDALKLACVNQIKSWADSERLISHPQLAYLLENWLSWDSEGACQRYIKKITDTDAGLVSFLCALLTKPIDQSIALNPDKSQWETYLVTMKTFISPLALKEHAELIFKDGYFEKLREREQLAILIFLDLVKSDSIKELPQTSN